MDPPADAADVVKRRRQEYERLAGATVPEVVTLATPGSVLALVC